MYTVHLLVGWSDSALGFWIWIWIFSFLKNQRIRSPLSQASKTFFFNFLTDFRVTVQIFWGPATKETGIIRAWNFGIGVQQQFGTRMCSIFFSSKSLHPTIQYSSYIQSMEVLLVGIIIYLYPSVSDIKDNVNLIWIQFM